MREFDIRWSTSNDGSKTFGTTQDVAAGCALTRRTMGLSVSFRPFGAAVAACEATPRSHVCAAEHRWSSSCNESGISVHMQLFDGGGQFHPLLVAASCEFGCAHRRDRKSVV